MFEKYFTVMAFFIVARGLCIFPYIYILRRTNLKYKNGAFILNRWFNSYDTNTWRIFWSAVLWLVIFYHSSILCFAERILIYLQSIPIVV